MEVEARVKALAYKVKGMSRESASQKATHVLDADLRTHWSTATNTKEWILLELNVIIFSFIIFIFTFWVCQGFILQIPQSKIVILAGALLAFSHSDSQQVGSRMGNFCWFALQGQLTFLPIFFFLDCIFLILRFALLSTARNICESTSPL